MPWLKAFEDLIEASGARVSPDLVAIEDPATGRLEGAAAVQAFWSDSAAWLQARDAVTRPIAMTIGLDRPARRVGEFELDLTMDDRRSTLPVAVVVEAPAGGRPTEVRIYHSQWPLLGRHLVRPPLLTADPAVTESDVVGEYQAALAAGDAVRIVATFDADGCFREPAGPQYRVCGRRALSAFFGRFFSAGGGIALEHCTVTEDGVRTALEYNAVRWGGVDLPPQAGIAVYERGPTGRIAHARIYDDVEGPVV